MARKRHPMNVCLGEVERQLGVFLASRATMLRWLVSSEELPFVEEGFAKAAKSVKRVELSAPFDMPTAHGLVLAKDLLGKARAKDWRAPAVVSGMDDVNVIALMAESLARHLGDRVHLVVELAPRAVTDPRAYARWLSRCVAAFSKTRVRLAVLESIGTRAHEALASELGQAVLTLTANQHVDEAVEALAEAQSNDTTAGQIRVLLVRCMHACKRRQIDRALGLAGAVVSLADDIAMPELAVPAYFAVGAAWMGAARYPDAVRAYREADTLATRAEAAGHPEGTKLRVYARMGVGSALLAGEGFELAGTHFAETAPLAAKALDLRLELECHRLAAHAFERAGKLRSAWDTGFAGIGVIVRTEPGARPRDTCRELGVAMMRLTEKRELGHYRDALVAQLDRHLGRGWATPSPAHAPAR